MSPHAARPRASRVLPAFAAPYAPPDEALAAALLARRAARRPPPRRASTPAPRGWSRRSGRKSGGLGGIEDFLRDYSLSTREGLALMVLAEALLRVPDAATADRLIEDKLAAGDWTHHEVEVERAAGLGLGLGARHLGAHHPAGRDAGEHPRSLVKRLGLPAVRAATRQAMRLLGSHFVLGQTIEEALGARRRTRASSATPSTCSARARAPPPTPSAISRPMRDAIEAIGAAAGNARCRDRPGHLGQALGAASALRGAVARARARAS